MFDEYKLEWEAAEGAGYVSPWGADTNGLRMDEPKRNYPITEKENYERIFAGKKPVYMPFMTDMLAFSPRVIPDHLVRAFVLEMDALLPGAAGVEGGLDMFGVEWQYVPITGGSMVKPGDPKIKDITKWEEYITFPDLDSWDWEGSKARNAPLFNPDRMTRVWLMNGLNERLISLMDFANVMVAYVDEDQKDGVHRFYDKLCDFYDDLIDHYHRYFNADVLMFNDDWGTMRGPQFSLATAREMIVPYIKRIVESCHKRGMYFELHCCGKNDILVPAMIEAGVDFWCPQEVINDFDLLYELTRDKLHIAIPTDSTPEMTDEEALESAKRFMDKYGKYGNVSVNPTFPLQHPRVNEFIYYLSRDAYKQFI
jgi:hypothetical protein